MSCDGNVCRVSALPSDETATQPQPQLEGRVILLAFTDPYCTWCWGAEPVLRRLKEQYGTQVQIVPVMGGLMPSLERFGGAEFFPWVQKHHREASERHGMPHDVRVWQDVASEFTGTWPANLACKAAQLANPEMYEKYVRRLRQAAACERQAIHRVDVQTRIAEEVGVNVAAFTNALADGTAQQAFDADRALCAQESVSGFPTFIVKHAASAKRHRLSYAPFEAFEAAIQKVLVDGPPLAKAPLPEFSEEAVLRLVRGSEGIATKEIVGMFEVPDHTVLATLKHLEGKQCVTFSGFLWKA
eukprot:NODE_3063_length_1038_cov_26.450055_g2920_i0.p1 GENE.NODE_3063_length_1038_cov_26.450055_g2920_i0~~NODE_3063_length_1038_cov_26.450055_g2920_i0.p1  ORF type:complete len:319 (+),score=62.52 NODE_3063_length_1038_cov_26.450055_g2920_i0:60-959(+)